MPVTGCTWRSSPNALGCWDRGEPPRPVRVGHSHPAAGSLPSTGAGCVLPCLAASGACVGPGGRGWTSALVQLAHQWLGMPRMPHTQVQRPGASCACGDISVRPGTGDAFGDGIAVPDGVECPRPGRHAPGRAECPRRRRGCLGDGPRGSCPHRRNARGPARCIPTLRDGHTLGLTVIVTTRPHRKDVTGVPGQESLGHQSPAERRGYPSRGAMDHQVLSRRCRRRDWGYLAAAGCCRHSSYQWRL